MKISSFSTEYKEKRNHIELTVYHDYFFRKGNKTYNANKELIIKIQKPTKEEIIKEAHKNK